MNAHETPNITVDIARLDAGIEWCRDNPELHDQSEYAAITACGTTLCLAGAILQLNGWRPVFRFGLNHAIVFENPEGDHVFARKAASDLLGLSERQSHELFLSSDTLEDLVDVRNRIASGSLQ